MILSCVNFELLKGIEKYFDIHTFNLGNSEGILLMVAIVIVPLFLTLNIVTCILLLLFYGWSIAWCDLNELIVTFHRAINITNN